MAANPAVPSSHDSWLSAPIPCKGGLILNTDPLTLGTRAPGAAVVLQNFECSLDSGYRKMSGYTKYDSAAVPGTANEPVTGVKVALGGVFAVRKLLTDNAIYFSSGSGWGSPLNAVARTGSVSKVRGTISVIGTDPSIILCDGVNAAWKYDGTTETDIDGTGAPANPKYAEIFFSRLVLAGYGDGNLIAFSAPNTDDDFDSSNGALEFNVGDIVVAVKTFRNELIIFCQRFIKKVIGDGSTASPFTVVDVANFIGCSGTDTVQEMGGDLIFLSGDTMRSYAATARINDAELSSVCPQIQPLVREIINLNFDNDDYSVCCIRRKNQYRLFINDPDNTTADTGGLVGVLQDAQSSELNSRNTYEWSTMLGIKPYCADANYTSGLEIAVIGDPTNGYVYLLESGNTFDGTNINAIYRSPDLTFDDANLRKTFQKITILGKVEGDFTSTLNLILERGDVTTIQPPSISLSSMGSTTVLYGSAVYDTSTYGQFATPVFKQNLIGSGFLGAFQFSSTDGNAPYTINAFQILFSLKGRR